MTTTAFVLSVLLIGAIGYLWHIVRGQHHTITRLSRRVADMELEEAINKKFREKDPEWQWPPREEMKD